MMEMNRNTVVLDLETAHSAEDCSHCGQAEEVHVRVPMLGGHSGVLRYFAGSTGHGFQAIGWESKAALGLSIGCYYDYADTRCHFFDVHTLEETVRHLVERQSLLVSFNGIAFDFPLMRGLLRQSADAMNRPGPGGDAQSYAARLRQLCDAFKILCASSYDILAEIWKIDPARKFEPGLNSLGAIGRANGLGDKLSSGAQAPRDWQAGRHAQAINYVMDDVLKTKALFEQIVDTGSILRGDSQPIRLRCPLDLVEP